MPAVPDRFQFVFRLLLAGAVLLLAGALAAGLLGAVDTLADTWQRLQQQPLLLRVLLSALLAALAMLTLWALWQLLRPARARRVAPQPLDRPAIEARMAALPAESAVAAEVGAQLRELDRRRADAVVYVVLFGEISSGKSSVLRALGAAPAAVGVTGGTTHEVVHAQAPLPDGTRLMLADVPGTNEVDGAGWEALARAEAAQAHVLVYLCDGDLTRSQEAELTRIARFGKPVLLVLNKRDRYTDDELGALLQRLRERGAAVNARLLAISAGGAEEVWREQPDGRRERVSRQRPADVAALQDALGRLAVRGAAVFEAAREAAVLAEADAGIDAEEQRLRARRSDETVRRYTRRAMVGALAAVAPGTDLIIQGALATALTRELCAIHGLGARDVDLEQLVKRIGATVRTSSSLVLAIAGNALKAFPGLGTLGGGLVHALAYGLIFDSLGRALTATLAQTRELDREAILQAFGERLQQPRGERLRELGALAVEIIGSEQPETPTGNLPAPRGSKRA